MANMISVNVVRPTADLNFTSPCQQFAINVDNIQSIQDAPAALGPGAKSIINLKYVVANHFKAHTLYVNEARATIVTASNA